MQLYKFQEESIDGLCNGKHICIQDVGCLAKGTPITLSNGLTKPVEQLKSGDALLSYDEFSNEVIENIVDGVFRICHKPKPMIELSYGQETITTTYDHPFFNGEGYYPLYQLIWGALEASQRLQLKLLCEQYGTSFNNTAVWCKHCSSNETVKGREWVLQDNARWTHCQGAQNSGRELVGEPYQLGMCEPYKLQPNGQSSRKLRMVFEKIQCLVGGEKRYDKNSREQLQKTSDTRAKAMGEELLSKQYRRTSIPKEETTLRFSSGEVPEHLKVSTITMGTWNFKVKTAEPYYAISMRQAPYTYFIGERCRFITHNTGKSAVMMRWLKAQHPTKVLIITTASKSRSGDFIKDADTWNGAGWRESLKAFEIISWHKASEWVKDHQRELGEWTYGIDELQRSKAGVSSGMGKAFLKITLNTSSWAGFTATPGDNWLHFYPYFQACGFVSNKTNFKRRFVIEQNFKGFPEIIGWRDEETLKQWWDAISITPDTSQMFKELPSQTHKVIEFKKPTGYNKLRKTRIGKDGEFIETTMGLCHALRELSFTEEKKQWLSDFIGGLGTGCVLFYNYIEEGNEIEDIVNRVKKVAKVWRIDGSHHDIPTADTIGKYDVVLCQWQSGSEALNLQFLNYWVSVTPTYSYITSTQARGRIRRIGQKRPQFYYYLKCEGIETAVYEALKNKKDFSEDVYINGGKGGKMEK